MSENKYKKAMDGVCDRQFRLTGEEMLEKAKASSAERNITMNAAKKRNIIGKFIGTAAACVVISGTVASAMGYGPLGDSFRRFFGKDEVTAKIIDEGHFCEIGKELSDDMFTVVLVSVTGDLSSPKMLFDITVKDEQLAAENDRLQIYVYTLSEEKYLNELDHYGMWDAYGEKDPEVNNLYHVCMNSASSFMINEEEVIAAVKQISFENDSVNNKFDYDVNMEYRFTVPKQALKETVREYYDDILMNSGNIDYRLFFCEFGAYDSLFKFKYDFLGTELAGGETDYDKLDEKFDKDWHRFSDTFILSVDGTEYEPKELGYGYCDEEGEAFEAGTCSTWMTFPSVDYENAENVTLFAGGKAYELKGKAQELKNEPVNPRPDNEKYKETDALSTYDYDNGEVGQYFDDIVLSSGNVDYRLFYCRYGKDETSMTVKFDFLGTELAGDETDYDKIDEKFDKDWHRFSDTFILSVDGTEYEPKELGYSYYDKDGESFEPGTCSIGLTFPGINFAEAESVTLTANDKTIILK